MCPFSLLPIVVQYGKHEAHVESSRKACVCGVRVVCVFVCMCVCVNAHVHTHIREVAGGNTHLLSFMKVFVRQAFNDEPSMPLLKSCGRCP